MNYVVTGIIPASNNSLFVHILDSTKTKKEIELDYSDLFSVKVFDLTDELLEKWFEAYAKR